MIKEKTVNIKSSPLIDNRYKKYAFCDVEEFIKQQKEIFEDIYKIKDKNDRENAIKEAKQVANTYTYKGRKYGDRFENALNSYIRTKNNIIANDKIDKLFHDIGTYEYTHLKSIIEKILSKPAYTNRFIAIEKECLKRASELNKAKEWYEECTKYFQENDRYKKLLVCDEGRIAPTKDNIYILLRFDKKLNVRYGTLDTSYYMGYDEIATPYQKEYIMSHTGESLLQSYCDIKDSSNRNGYLKGINAFNTTSKDYIPRYDKIAEMFDNLPDNKLSEADGKELVETFFIKYFNLKDTPLNREISRLVFSGIINRAYASPERPEKFDYVLNLHGKQGYGKSTIAKLLSLYPNESIGRLTDFDDEQKRFIQTNGQHIVVVDEGDRALRNPNSAESFKAFVGDDTDSCVLKFSNTTSDIVKKYVVVLTSNKEEVIYDDTGNRRIIPINCDNMVDVIENYQKIKEDIKLIYSFMRDIYKQELITNSDRFDRSKYTTGKIKKEFEDEFAKLLKTVLIKDNTVSVVEEILQRDYYEKYENYAIGKIVTSQDICDTIYNNTTYSRQIKGNVKNKVTKALKDIVEQYQDCFEYDNKDGKINSISYTVKKTINNKEVDCRRRGYKIIKTVDFTEKEE